MFIHYLLLRRLASYKVCLCFIVLSVTVCTVGHVCSFHGDQIFVNFVSFLSMRARVRNVNREGECLTTYIPCTNALRQVTPVNCRILSDLIYA